MTRRRPRGESVHGVDTRNRWSAGSEKGIGLIHLWPGQSTFSARADWPPSTAPGTPRHAAAERDRRGLVPRFHSMMMMTG
jgi:hypothetical protein